MPNVNDLKKMYGQPTSNSSQARAGDQNGNIPAWKLELQKNRAKRENESTNTPSWKTNSNGPTKSWNKPAEIPPKPAETPPKPAWQKPKPIVPTNKPVNKTWERPAEKREDSTPPKPAWSKPKPLVINEHKETSNVTKPWENSKPAGNQSKSTPPWLQQKEERNKPTSNSTTAGSNVAPWSKKPPSPVEKSNSPISRTDQITPPWQIPRSNSSSTSSRPSSYLSQNGSQSGDVRSRVNSFNVNPQINAPPPPSPIDKPKANKPSFLHKPPTSGVKPAVPTPSTPPFVAKPPQRKPIPDHKSQLPAPVKPNRPGFVQIHASWVASHESIAKLPASSKHKRLLPIPNSGAGPPLPPVPGSGLPGSGLPPPLPGRSPLHSPGSNAFGLPPPVVDDTYDDTDLPPPLPISNNRKMATQPQEPEQIETWEDEEDALYDETADGDQPPLPEEGESEELYEDVETYMKSKADRERDEKAKAKEDEKKIKEKKKKEKELKKKFSIKEDEIRVECEGTVKVTSKGGGKDLAVQAQQKIEIIRMHDNPKGKWLVRNLEGKYGFVESENIDVNTNIVKSQMNSFRQNQPFQSGNFPPPQFEEDVIYDETAEDEDIYEEV